MKHMQGLCEFFEDVKKMFDPCRFKSWYNPLAYDEDIWVPVQTTPSSEGYVFAPYQPRNIVPVELQGLTPEDKLATIERYRNKMVEQDKPGVLG